MNAFSELKTTCPGLLKGIADAAVLETITDNPSATIAKLELLAEHLARCILAFEVLKEPEGSTQTRRLNILSNRGLLPPVLLPFFQVLNRDRQEANRSAVNVHSRVTLLMQLAERLASWFSKSYVLCLPPAAKDAEDAEDVFKSIRENPPSEATRRSARKAAVRRANMMQLSEGETRVMIDFQLRAAGWQADSLLFRYSQGSRPEKGVNKAIAEWETETGPADYALFAGLDFIGVVEAKKMGKDVVADLTQSKRYSNGAKLDGQARFVEGPWGDYRVPFLFSTNARPYFDQLKEKSGIWFLDARCPTNHPRPLQGWYSAEELIALFKQDIPAAQGKLANEPLDYLGLRDYQEKAVQKIEAALDQGRNRLLVAMATGTGKTRLAIGLIYRLINSNRFRRVLFVVDRNALGEQAGDKFKETRLEELKTFDQIYDLKDVYDSEIEPTTKVKIATVQALMHAVMYPSES